MRPCPLLPVQVAGWCCLRCMAPHTLPNTTTFRRVPISSIGCSSCGIKECPHYADHNKPCINRSFLA